VNHHRKNVEVAGQKPVSSTAETRANAADISLSILIIDLVQGVLGCKTGFLGRGARRVLSKNKANCPSCEDDEAIGFDTGRRPVETFAGQTLPARDKTNKGM